MKKTLPFLFITGYLLLLAGAITYFNRWEAARPLFTIGATLVAVAQIQDRYRGNNRNIRRLNIQQIFGSLFLVMTAVMMYTTSGNEWIITLSIATVFQLYPAFRIPTEEKREKKG